MEQSYVLVWTRDPLADREAGITFADEAMATQEVRVFLEGLLYEKAVPTLEAIPDHRDD